MTRRFFGLQGALLGVLLFGSCKQDSITTVGIGNPAGVSLELKARTIILADSVRTFALVRDQVGNPLAIAVALTTGCTAGIVSIGPASDAPLVRTAFIVKAVGYGTGCVIASASGFVDTMTVTTVPASLVVTGVSGVIKPDTANSGSVVTYSYAYKDKAGAVISGLPASTVPTLSSADTTIAQITGLTAAGRAPGVVTLTLKGTAGLSTIKSLAVLPIPFTGTTAGAVQPGQILKIVRDPAGPVFDANTAVSIGKAIGTIGPDTLSVRVSDVASSGTKTFSLTGVGPNDLAYSGGSYTVNAPPAFTGTVTPAPVVPSATVWIHRDLVNDPVFDVNMKVFRGASASSLAALTVDTSTVRPDSFKVGKISDLQAGGTYVFQFTRLGIALQTRRGSYVLSVGTWGGTLTPNSGDPTNKIVLRRGAGDPTFVAGTRVYLGGIRTFIDSYSADTAVVIVPAFGATGATDMRISRMGATNLAVDGIGVLTSTSATVLDPYGYSNLTPDMPVAITANGNTYIVESGSCPNGIAASGGEKCDSYFKVTNTRALPDTITVSAGWFDGVTDADLIICKGDALSNPVPNNVPKCGNFPGGGADQIACACSISEGPPEVITLILAPGKTWVIWVNMFSPNNPAELIQLNVSGLK
jgi:hypothetical protein